MYFDSEAVFFLHPVWKWKLMILDMHKWNKCIKYIGREKGLKRGEDI